MALEGLEGLIKGLEQQESWQVQKQFRLVLLHWPKSVGFAIARITRPISIQRDTLYVATSTSAWAQTLSYERFNILRKLNRYQKPPLKGIRFSTAQWAQRAPLNPLNQSGNPTENLAARGKLAHHPSYIGDVPHLTSPAPEAAPTPAESFARWASAMQDMQRSQALCPRCHCHCPKVNSTVGPVVRSARPSSGRESAHKQGSLQSAKLRLAKICNLGFVTWLTDAFKLRRFSRSILQVEIRPLYIYP